jgi:transcriptional regulator with XRE-family HTH domain
VAPSHLSRAERGEKGLSIDALYRVAVVLQMDDLAKSLSPYVEQEGS